MLDAAADTAREPEGGKRERVLEAGAGGGTVVLAVDGAKLERRVDAEDDGVNLDETLMRNLMGLPGPVAPASGSSNEEKIDR